MMVVGALACTSQSWRTAAVATLAGAAGWTRRGRPALALASVGVLAPVPAGERNTRRARDEHRRRRRLRQVLLWTTLAATNTYLDATGDRSNGPSVEDDTPDPRVTAD